MSNAKGLEILTVQEHRRWMEALEEAGAYDFFHLPSFHKLAEDRGEGTAVMPVYREDGCTIAFPMLLRPVDLPLAGCSGSRLQDVTSVYGYAGPVAPAGIGESTKRAFHLLLQEFYDSHQVISAFARLHPLLDQSVLAGLGEVADIGVTVSIDLTAPPEEQVARYRKSHRYEIRRLKSAGFTCEQAGAEEADTFTRVYQDTMRELGANPYYFFDSSYFEYLLNEMSDVMRLFICREGGRPACAALFAQCNGIIQYYLAGTSADYRRLAPMKLVLDSAREWGCASGARVLHLGGGVGARKDSLYDFKRGFSDREHTYSIWKHVVNETIYNKFTDELCAHVDKQALQQYFPSYRHPKVQLISV